MKLTDLVSPEELIDFCKVHNIIYLAVFGSMAEETADAASDIDLLVKYRRRVSLIKHVEIQQALETKLGRKVDLVTVDSLHPRLRDRILSSKKTIYDEAI